MTDSAIGAGKARLAIDIGGTFTDLVLQHADGRRDTTKLLTTYAHPGEAVLHGTADVLRQAGLQPADVGLVIHGTTLATNALIERRGARTALLTTAGHRDALEMAHEDRFEQYDIQIDRPRPLVPRYLRLPVTERMDHAGRILLPLDQSSLAACLPVLDEHAVESVAIGYLHAFVNPEHELRTAEWLQRARPGLAITLASEVCPEIREFERLSTACANAYVQPLMARYLRRLGADLQQRGLDCPFLLMTSGGGLTTLETAARFPVRLIESGPAGGAILAQQVARETGARKVLSFDMGGTTAKLCLIDDFQALGSRSFEVDRVYRFKKGSGLPVRIPVIEMVEIGAGGGSIARVDKLRRIQVGPASAGSEPGPAAYGRGGDRPTVTDADVHQGRVYAPLFAAGAVPLDLTAAGAALATHIAEPLGLESDAAALGVCEVVDENMAAAARAHAAEFGVPLADREMVAFGGAAPLHAARLGEKLGVRRIVIPTEAGVGSAIGFLLAPVAYEVVRSRHQRLDQLDPGLINALVQEMQAEARAVVRLGTTRTDLQETRQAYMRYVGQGHEIAVPLPVEVYTGEHAGRFRAAFEAVYARLYGRTIAGMDIEVLSWTLTIAAPLDPLTVDPAQSPEIMAPETMTPKTVTPETATSEPVTPAPAAADAPSPPTGQNDPAGHSGARRPDEAGLGNSRQAGLPEPVAWQPCLDAATAERVSTPVYLRRDLQPGHTVHGPALIAEEQTTTVVTARYSATIDPRGYIVMMVRD